MNVFDAIYLNDKDPIDCSFIAAETALDIAIARANKEYVYESGLIELSDNNLFTESYTDESNNKKQNAFVKVITSICTAIKNFIGDIINSIATLFDNKKNITAEEYFESPTGKLEFQKDIVKLEEVVDDEIRKGNKLLQAVSSKTGIPDKEIDTWIRTGTEKIDKLAPVIIPAATAFGFTKLFNGILNKASKKVDDVASEAKSGDNTDSKKNSQKLKIFGHIENLYKQVGNGIKDFTKVLNKAKKKSN